MPANVKFIEEDTIDTMELEEVRNYIKIYKTRIGQLNKKLSLTAKQIDEKSIKTKLIKLLEQRYKKLKSIKEDPSDNILSNSENFFKIINSLEQSNYDCLRQITLLKQKYNDYVIEQENKIKSLEEKYTKRINKLKKKIYNNSI